MREAGTDKVDRHAPIFNSAAGARESWRAHPAVRRKRRGARSRCIQAERRARRLEAGALSLPANATDLPLRRGAARLMLSMFTGLPGDYGHKRACNNRIGPGGGTRRLHQTYPGSFPDGLGPK